MPCCHFATARLKQMTGMSPKPWALEPFIHPQWQKPELNFILSCPPLYTFELGTAKAHEVRMTNVRIFIFLIWKYILVISSSFLLKIVLRSSKKHAEILCSSHPWGWSPLLPHPHSATPQKNLWVVHADCGGTTDPGLSWNGAWAFSERKLCIWSASKL